MSLDQEFNSKELNNRKLGHEQPFYIQIISMYELCLFVYKCNK